MQVPTHCGFRFVENGRNSRSQSLIGQSHHEAFWPPPFFPWPSYTSTCLLSSHPSVFNSFLSMAEPLTGTLPPPLPPRPSALPPRSQVTSAPQIRRTIASTSPIKASVISPITSKFESTTPETLSIQESQAITSNTPLKCTVSASGILSDIATPSAHPSTEVSTQSSPKLLSLILSFILREPIERSHGRLSTIIAVQSFFQSNLPAPPPFEYSSLVDHVLFASQIALHDPQMRQQKRLPLVLSLSIGAFLIAATRIISRYFGWALLAAATWFGPARFIMKEMWYISVGLIVLNFFVDIFPMLSLYTLLSTGVICVSRSLDNFRTSRRESTVPQFRQNTAKTFQAENDPKRIALDMVQNVAEWWTYRQSEPERHRRAEEKAVKKALEEEKKLNKLRRAETLKEQKQTEIDQKAAKKLRKLEEEKCLKQMKQEKKAEKQQKKDEELALKRTKLEEKGRAKELKRQEELDLKHVKNLKKGKKLNAVEEKEGQTKEDEELDIRQRILEEEGNELQPDINVSTTPAEIDPKMIPPSVYERTANPPSSSIERLPKDLLLEADSSSDASVKGTTLSTPCSVSVSE
jgi:hypothetical protein